MRFHLLLDVGIAERHDCCCCKRILNSTDRKSSCRGKGKTSYIYEDARIFLEKPKDLKTHKMICKWSIVRVSRVVKIDWKDQLILSQR